MAITCSTRGAIARALKLVEQGRRRPRAGQACSSRGLPEPAPRVLRPGREELAGWLADRKIRQHTSADLGTIIAAVERRTAQAPLSKASAHTGHVGCYPATPGAPYPSIKRGG